MFGLQSQLSHQINVFWQEIAQQFVRSFEHGIPKVLDVLLPDDLVVCFSGAFPFVAVVLEGGIPAVSAAEFHMTGCQNKIALGSSQLI